MSRLVLLDIDGTLLRSDGAGRASVKRTLLDLFGTDGGIDTYRFGGRTDMDTIFTLMRAQGIPEEDITAKFAGMGPRIAATLEELVTTGQKRIDPLPGALELFEAVHTHHDMTLGVVTGNTEDSAMVKLRLGGFNPTWVVAGAYGSESAVRADLPPLAVRRAEALTGLRYQGERVIVIGDTTEDVIAGRAIGARVLTVLTGSDDHAALSAERPHAILDDLSDTDAVLAAILA